MVKISRIFFRGPYQSPSESEKQSSKQQRSGHKEKARISLAYSGELKDKQANSQQK